MYTLFSRLGPIRASEGVTKESLELVTYWVSRFLSFPAAQRLLTEEVRRAGVHAAKVGRSFYGSPFFRGESWEATFKRSFRMPRMIPEISEFCTRQARPPNPSPSESGKRDKQDACVEFRTR